MGKYVRDKSNEGIRPNFHNGEKRWVCQCGEHFFDGVLALLHLLDGHEVFLEVYSMGVWTLRDSLQDVFLNSLRAKGESIEDFTVRMEKLADNMEDALEAEHLVG